MNKTGRVGVEEDMRAMGVILMMLGAGIAMGSPLPAVRPSPSRELPAAAAAPAAVRPRPAMKLFTAMEQTLLLTTPKPMLLK